MTKIKNTKKGMAKKTLSISLVAAMLATSNVPVWATEFSDGSSDTAVEFSTGVEEAAPAEFFESEAPVVETETVEAAEKTVINKDSYTYVPSEGLTVKDGKTYIITGSSLTANTGDLTPKPGYEIVSTAWYKKDGSEADISTTNKQQYAYTEGVYTLKAQIKDTNVGTTATVVIYEVTAVPNLDIAIVGTPTLKETHEGQWGYEVTAEFDTNVPEGYTFAYRWERCKKGSDEWVPAKNNNEEKQTDSLKAAYTLTEDDFKYGTEDGTLFRVVALYKSNISSQVTREVPSASFEIQPLNVAYIISTEENNYGLSKDVQTPKLSEGSYIAIKHDDVTIGGNRTKITEGDYKGYVKLNEDDFELKTQDITQPGVRTVIIELTGSFKGVLKQDVYIDRYDIDTCEVTLKTDKLEFVGDGKCAIPEIVKVTWAGDLKELTEGVHYSVDEESYKKNINAGKYCFKIDGLERFTKSEKYKTYEIVSRSMDNCNIKWTGRPIVEGEELVAGRSMTDNAHFIVYDDNGYVLEPDVDYTWTKDGIWHNVPQQQCKVTVTAIKRRKDLVNDKIVENIKEATNDANYYGTITSDYVTVGLDIHKTLTKYVASVVKEADYTGSEITFRDDLKIISVEDIAKAYYGTKNPTKEQIESIGFKDPLKYGIDFDVTYKNNVNAYLLKDKDGNYLTGTKMDDKIDEIYHYSQKDGVGVDYDEENDDPQAPQVYLTLKNGFSGTTTPVRFAINQINLTEKAGEKKVDYTDITFDPAATDTNAENVYKSQMDAVKLTYSKAGKENILKNNEDYKVEKCKYLREYHGKDVSTENGVFQYKVIAHHSDIVQGTGSDQKYVSLYDGNYYGVKECFVEIQPKRITSEGIQIADIANQKYTGTPIKPEVTITDGAYTLQPKVDYTLSYNNNLSAGKATITVTGLDDKGRYTGVTTKTFVIENKSIADAKIMKTGVYNKAYTDLSKYSSSDYVLTNGVYDGGRKVEADFDVVDANNNLLRKGYDYTVKYENNTGVGTATITITGMGDYEGTLTGTFNIVGKGIGGHFTQESIPVQTYTGSAIEPKVNFIPYPPNLVEGVDYEITYEYNVNPGKAEDNNGPKVVARGIGNYGDSVKLGFEIKKADITIANVTAEPAPYAGGMVAESKITVTNPASGKALIEGTDYKVEYVSGKNVGDTGTANLLLLNNQCYTFNKDDSDLATIVATYDIVAKDLKDVTIDAVADQTETGEQIKPALTVKNGNALLREGIDYEVTYGENKEGTGTATIKPAEGNKNYTGSQTVSFNIVKPAPEVGQAVIANVAVNGNTLTPILADYADGAEGYDFVLSTVENTKDGRVAISKNVIEKDTKFYYVEEGTYYVYCHAWKRDPETKKKVFGEWSNIYKVEVTAVTPSTPQITSVKKSGNTVTVTFTGSKDATGYDVILGTAYKAVNGEKRPVEYGKLVKKNQDETTVVFTNVPKGTYYAGVHAYNRTSANGKKVFSKWSNAKKVTVQ